MCKSSPRMAPTLAAVTARAAPGAAAVPTAAMARAEAAAAEVVRCVQPTEASERRRAEVVGYARRLVGSALGCEVFAFGSVPLKTYLPDGDIDLTVLGNTLHDGYLIDDVYCTLVPEEQNSDAEFEVKDLQRIDAEVKLIKCTIDNIIVDISFNQTGGMCALCFLELVDREIGKEHLFKRSIILIKAWCYYESRLLGAHHGLISTYALEILILYIFNLFHKSLDGPLEVLYRFLEYFSKFDWDNYCISLNGPVALSSMPNSPNLIVETTSMPGDDLLFNKELFESSVEKETDERCTKFRVKHLNIIDPLKECNNLGRSVNKANFNRIRTALSYGARRLGQILMLPSELIPDEIFCFFVNTLKRNGKGVRPDIGVAGYDCDVHCQPFIGHDRVLLEDLSSMKISYKKNDENSINRLSQNFGNNSQNNEINVPTQGGYFPGDQMLPPSTDLSKKSSHFFHYAPKQYSYVCRENGNGGSGQYYVDHEMKRHICSTAEAFHEDAKSLMRPQVRVNNSSHILDSSIHGNAGPANKKSWSRTLPHVEKQHLPLFSTLSLPDLSGDLDSQLRCLRQVQYHLEYLFDELFQSVQEASSEGLWSPSSTESNESSSLSSSNSTGDVSQHSQDEDHWSVACQQNAFGIDVPSSGLSPSYYDDSESPVLCCCSLEKIASMHGTGPYTLEKHLALLEETGKSRSNQPVEVIYNQALVPKGSCVPCKEQVALDSRTKELKTNQLWKTEGGLHGYVLSGRNMIENWSGDTRKGCVKPDNKAWQVPKYYGKVFSNKNLFQKRSNCNDTEFARPARAMKQTPKHQALEVQVTANSRICINNKSGRKQSYGTRKGHQIFDWPTNERPICQPSKLQSSLRGRVFSNKNLAVKQSYDNHSERLSSISDTKHTSNSQGLSILNGSIKIGNPGKGLAEDGSKPWSLLPKEPLSHVSGASQEMLTTSCQPCFSVMKEYYQSEALVTPPEEPIEFGSLGPCPLKFFSSESNKAHNRHTTNYACTDASSLVLQSYRVGATQSRSAGFYKIGDDDHFPPLDAGTR